MFREKREKTCKIWTEKKKKTETVEGRQERLERDRQGQREAERVKGR